MTTLRHVTRSWKTLKNASVGSEKRLAYKVLLTYTTYRLTAEEARDRLAVPSGEIGEVAGETVDKTCGAFDG